MGRGIRHGKVSGERHGEGISDKWNSRGTGIGTGNHMHVQVRSRAGEPKHCAKFGWRTRDNTETIGMDLIASLLPERRERITGELRRMNQITLRKVHWSGETGVPGTSWRLLQ